jgi:hypothetical protein
MDISHSRDGSTIGGEAIDTKMAMEDFIVSNPERRGTHPVVLPGRVVIHLGNTHIDLPLPSDGMAALARGPSPFPPLLPPPGDNKSAPTRRGRRDH